jgi:hypothetical protein
MKARFLHDGIVLFGKQVCRKNSGAFYKLKIYPKTLLFLS